MRGLALGSLLALPSCDRSEPPAGKPAEAAPKAEAPQGEGDVGTAERLVRGRLGNPEGLTFAGPRRTVSEGVTIICGRYSQGGASNRYIVVDSTDVFIEPRLQPGEMDRYFAEFCRDAAGSPPAPVAAQGNEQ